MMKILTVAILAVLMWCSLPNGAMACQVNCGVAVPDLRYHGGGVQVKTVLATACFDRRNEFGEKYILDTILRFPYTADFVYSPKRGSYEIIDTIPAMNPCWTHYVPIGTWMSVYVTCRTYTGWVAVLITGPGTYTMRKVSWTFVEVLP